MSSSQTSCSRKRKKYTSSASESTEDTTGLPTKKLPTSASTWKIEDLDQQSIFFATEYVEIEAMAGFLKTRRSLDNFPRIVKSLVSYTKECLNFSIDEKAWQTCNSSVRPEQEKGIEILTVAKKNLRMFAQKIRVEESGLLDAEPLNHELFERWYCKVVDFLDQAIQLLNLLINEALEKINHEKQTSLLHIKEGSFTYLFMKFTEICFLTAEPGKGAKTDLWIRNKRVGCLPDICYWQQSTMPNRNILILLAEVKMSAFKDTEDPDTEVETLCRNEEKRPNKTPWIHSKVQPDVLAQLGCEMLSKCHYSMFVPEILGILCMKTKIIFNYLQLSNKHYLAVKSCKDIENMCSHIQYTNIYDIMKADDRNELLDLLFWLGCVQKRGLQSHYIIT